MLGFLKQRQKEVDFEIRENMIEYAIELLQDAVDFSWQAAKGAHYVLVHRIGDGSASWKDLDSVNKVRSRYSHSGNQRGQNFKHERASSHNLKPAPCFRYNNHKCPEHQEHAYKHLLLKHVCQHCFANNLEPRDHTKRNCPRLNGNQFN